VPRFHTPEITAVWMDVDLELSAQDALQVLPVLSPLGCVFSHECSPDGFRDGEILAPPRGPDSVVPPILDAFHAAGRRPTGRFVHGNTAAFWDRDHGIPVLSGDGLLRLKGAALEGI
jgi:O-methyltransferase